MFTDNNYSWDWQRFLGNPDAHGNMQHRSSPPMGFTPTLIDFFPPPPPAAFQAHTCRTARTLTGAASSRRLQAENPVVTVNVPVPKSIISILVDTFKQGHFSSLPNERINRVLDQQKSVGRGKERAGRSRIVHPSCRGEQNPSLVRRNDLLPLPRLSEGRRGMRSSLFVLYCLGHLHKKRLFVI